jgi:hypothetical protein
MARKGVTARGRKQFIARSPESCLSKQVPFPSLSSTTAILRKTNKLRIPRSPIRSNPILRKSPFCKDPPRLIKVDSPILHDLLDLAFRVDVEPGAGIAGCDVGGEVEGGRGEAGFDVGAEGGGEAGVEVGGAWEGGGEGGRWDRGEEAGRYGDGRHEGCPEGAG